METFSNNQNPQCIKILNVNNCEKQYFCICVNFSKWPLVVHECSVYSPGTRIQCPRCVCVGTCLLIFSAPIKTDQRSHAPRGGRMM